MELSVKMFLIVCPMLFLAGFVDSIAGGGGLISLPAYVFAGLPMHLAIGTNKLSSACGTSLATARFIRHRLINLRLVIPGILAAILGSAAGSSLSVLASEQLIRNILFVALPVAAFFVLNKNLFPEEGSEAVANRRSITICSVASLVVGLYDGFYGPGTGTLLMTLLVGAAHYSLNSAAGTTKVINLSTNIAALFTFLFSGKTLFVLGLSAGAFNIAGAYLGTKFFSEKGAAIAKPMIIIVICIFFIKVVGEMVGIF